MLDESEKNSYAISYYVTKYFRFTVAGDICGKKNDRITINGSEIADSGKNLEDKK